VQILIKNKVVEEEALERLEFTETKMLGMQREDERVELLEIII